MQDYKTIEDIFNQGLSDFEVDPSSNAWTGIDQQLDDLAMESLFQTNLSEVAIQPSAGVWKAIASQLPKAAFWQFSVNAFNAYTVAAFIAVITGLAFISLPLLQEEDLSVIDKNPLELAQNILPNTNQNTDDFKSVVNESSSNSGTKDLSELQASNIVHSSSGSGSGSSNGANSEFNSPNISSQEAIILVDEDTEDREPDNDKDKKTSKKTSSKTGKASNKSTFPESQVVKSSVEETQSENLGLKEQVIKHLVYIDTLIVYDTVPFYDTLTIERTTNQNKKIKNKTFNKRGLWSAQIQAGAFSSNPIYTSNIEGHANLAEAYNSASSGGFSYTYGLGVNYDYDRLRISSGLAYTAIQEEFNYETHRIETKPIVKHNLSENGYFMKIVKNIKYKYDPQYEQQNDTVSRTYTVKKSEYQNYIVVDTIWNYKIEPSWVHVSDSVRIIKYDTIRVVTYDTTYYNSVDTNVYSTYYENVNKYTYLEIPLSIGYAFTFDKLTLRPTAGALFSFMLNAKGKGISILNREEVYNLPDAKLPMMNVQVSMLFGLGIEYKLQDNFSVFLHPYYRRTLSSIYKKTSPLDKSLSGIGANFGVAIYFNSKR